MKRLLIFLVIVFYGNMALIAQDLCGTPSPTPPAWIFQNTSNRSNIIQQNSASNNTILNVFVHIVRSSNGQGLSSSIISGIISSLNTSYLNSKIQFNLIGSDYIDNDYYYNNLNNKESELFAVNSKLNAINIYVLGEATIWSWAGLAQNIPSIAYIIHGSYYNTSSLPHEMGHCLGLYHTHHGTVHEPGDINQCSELVNDNSGTCGDYIRDTAADPNVWANTTCNYTGTARDANGQLYTPDPANLMSYSYKPCRNLFTTLQSERMQNFIANTQILKNVIHYEISGPSQICTQATYTINNLPVGATVAWNPTPTGIVSGPTSGSSVTITKVGNSIIILTALINNSITLTKTVYVGSPQAVGIVSMSNLTYGGGNWFKVLPGTGFYNYEGSLTVGDDGLGTSYSWSLASKTPGKAAFWSTNGPYVDVAMKTTNTDLQLMCTSSNSCGSHSTYYTFSTGDMVPELVSLIPNPTSSQVEVNIGDAVATNALLSSTAENSNSTSYQIQVVDSYGLTVYSTTKKEKKFTLQTSSFRNGVYAVIVSDGINTYQNKLIVNH